MNKQWNWKLKEDNRSVPELKFDPSYGYCTEEQFNELHERLLLVRKNIYKQLESGTCLFYV